MLKKATALTAYNTYTCSICNTTSQAHPFWTSKTSPPSNHTTRPQRPQQQQQRPATQCRYYATVRDQAQGGRGRRSNQGAPDFRDNMNWPCRKTSAKATPIPTPYEIFELERGATYTKHRYYQLVKLYHPDKHGHYGTNMEGITPSERLERYRLVVQAHEILSDPVKRKAYDAYGAGWGAGRNTATRHTRGYRSGATGKDYGYGPEHDSSVFGNATWEDWERWYKSRAGDEQRQAYAGTYINPNAFASFVILMAVLTGILQATRAGQYSSSLTDKAQAFTEETQQFMTARAQYLSGSNSNSDDRIKHFLERRDPSRYGLKDEEEEMYRKHFVGENLPPSSSMASSASDGAAAAAAVPAVSAPPAPSKLRNKADLG